MTERRFRFWYYTVSHSMALLRSVGEGGEENIDIFFAAVSYIEIPTDMDGITIEEPTEGDKEYISRKLSNYRGDITVLVQGGKRFYIVAEIRKIKRNKLDLFELPFDIPSDMSSKFTTRHEK
ncbi:MAG: hypothetical protein KBA55_05890 [Ruminococcus sp.]|nr:hypothetical protein [Ruminococcus sp.]